MTLEPEVPRKRTTRTRKTTAEKRAEINVQRKELFEKGSPFAPVKRDEIVGIDGVLDQIDIVIHWLKNYKTYEKYEARLEPGILFEGEPGTGKTLVSRYIAALSDAHFISVRDFPHEGSFLDDRDIAALFNLARDTHKKHKKPIVIFWDEFEGAAGDRGGMDVDKDQVATVSQLTSELDGIGGKNAGILLIGCTNYGWKIDEALVRPGRMGIRIEFNAPDEYGKMILLDYYLGKRKTKGVIDTETLAHFFTPNTTASGVEEAVMEAWRLAVYRSMVQDHDVVMDQDDLIEVCLNRMIGQRPTFSNLSEGTLLRVAVHESAHAIAALVNGLVLKLVTVRPGTGALGRTFTGPVDHHLSSVEETMAYIRMCAAPLHAEEISGLGSSTGLRGDTASATESAMRLIQMQGQGDQSGYFSPHAASELRTHQFSPTISEDLLAKIDTDVQTALESALTDNERLFKFIGQENLIAIGTELMKQEMIIGSDFRDLVEDVVGYSTEELGTLVKYSIPNDMRLSLTD